MRSHGLVRIFTKALSAVLAAALVLGLAPAAAWAAPEPTGSLRFLCSDTAGNAYPGIALALYRDETMTAKQGEGEADETGVATISGLGTATYWVTVAAVPEGYEKPDVCIPVEAVDGTVTEYKLVFEKTGVGSAALENNRLKGISAAGTLRPAFTSKTTNYTLTLDEGTAQTTIRPILADPSAALYIDGKKAAKKTVSLRPGGKLTVRIRVKPAEGKSGYYTVTVLRARSTNADLAGLAASSGKLTPAFGRGTAGYTLKLPNTQCWVRIVPKLADSAASLSVTVDGRRSGGALTLRAGETRMMVIRVRAQAGNTRTVTVKITRAISHSAALSGLGASRGSLAPAFTPGETSYTLNLPAGQKSVTLSMKKGDVYQRYWVRVNGRFSGKTIYLQKGETKKAVITVKAQAGEAKTYTVTVTRGK